MKAIKLPFKLKRPVLACGADMKSAFALAAGNEAFLADGFGDLSDPDNSARYGEAVRKYEKRLGIRPEVVACDLHPGYFSTRFAEAYQISAVGCRLLRVQHHEAHVASAIIDGSVPGDVIGAAFDGTGFGSDGNVWGGEFFIGNLTRLKRAAHLDYIPMPGGEMAIRQPWRMAASYLYRALGTGFLKLNIGLVKKLDKKSWFVLRQMIDRGVNSPLTSSAGRLFDAAGSILLARQDAAFEAELPIILEDVAAEGCLDHYDFDIRPDKGLLTIDASRTIKGIIKDMAMKADIPVISAKFHNTVAGMIVATALELRKRLRIKKAVLTGGVFQNSYLTGKAVIMLEERGFDAHIHADVPTNDSGIAIGQVAIAGRRA
jgi:hydrogenase maturation protein HypF